MMTYLINYEGKDIATCTGRAVNRDEYGRTSFDWQIVDSAVKVAESEFGVGNGAAYSITLLPSRNENRIGEMRFRMKISNVSMTLQQGFPSEREVLFSLRPIIK